MGIKILRSKKPEVRGAKIDQNELLKLISLQIILNYGYQETKRAKMDGISH